MQGDDKTSTAFPMKEDGEIPGLELEDYFAIRFAQAYISHHGPTHKGFDELADEAYRFAEKMIEKRC